ncbi:MAG: hypothetical protein K0Q59_4154 [Paenibacillus sp.]|nr:hypothetical protein [Paenibacillus sp.]
MEYLQTEHVDTPTLSQPSDRFDTNPHEPRKQRLTMKLLQELIDELHHENKRLTGRLEHLEQRFAGKLAAKPVASTAAAKEQARAERDPLATRVQQALAEQEPMAAEAQQMFAEQQPLAVIVQQVLAEQSVAATADLSSEWLVPLPDDHAQAVPGEATHPQTMLILAPRSVRHAGNKKTFWSMFRFRHRVTPRQQKMSWRTTPGMKT